MEDFNSSNVKLSVLDFDYDSRNYEDGKDYFNQIVKFKSLLHANGIDLSLMDKLISDEMRKRPKIREEIFQMIMDKTGSFEEFISISEFANNRVAETFDDITENVIAKLKSRT